jgi:hypothetical protein
MNLIYNSYNLLSSYSILTSVQNSATYAKDSLSSGLSKVAQYAFSWFQKSEQSEPSQLAATVDRDAFETESRLRSEQRKGLSFEERMAEIVQFLANDHLEMEGVYRRPEKQTEIENSAQDQENEPEDYVIVDNSNLNLSS